MAMKRCVARLAQRKPPSHDSRRVTLEGRALRGPVGPTHMDERLHIWRVGWVERSNTHQLHLVEMMGFARLNPSYVLRAV